MKKRELVFKTEPLKGDNFTWPIKVDCNNQYFFKNLIPQKLQYPTSISENYTIEMIENSQLFRPKNNNLHHLNEDIAKLKLIYKEILEIYVPGEEINFTWNSIEEEIKKDRNSHILGGKKYNIEEDLYKQRDCVFFAKKSIKEFIKHIRTYQIEEGLLFPLDEIFSRNRIMNGHREVAKIIIKEKEEIIKKAWQHLDITIEEITVELSAIPKKPKISLNLSVFGDMNNIHELYVQIEMIINSFIENCIEIKKESFMQEKLNEVAKIFEETPYNNKVYRTSAESILILKQNLTIEEVEHICRELSMQLWHLDISDGFTQEDIDILSQQETREFMRCMQEKEIFWERIDFTKNSIKIVCDVSTKEMFIKESLKYLNSFEKEEKICKCFQNPFEIHIFKKYYLNTFTNKFKVQFHLRNNTLYWKNFNKHSQQIDDELEKVKESIIKKVIKLVIGKHLQESNEHLFMQVKNPTGYKKNQLGCKLFLFGKMRIKVKQIESLKNPEEVLVYPIDETLSSSSIFHEIIAETGINFQSFCENANKKKNSIKLIQKFKKIAYSNNTCLFSASNQNESTFTKNIEEMLNLFEENVSISIMKHEEKYYWNVLKNVLVKIEENFRINGKANDVNIYYEGGNWALEKIKSLLKNLQARIITEFYVEQQDAHKVYALQYNKLSILPYKAQDRSELEHLSPIIAFLLDYEIKVEKKRLTFSYFPRKKMGGEENQQLIEYIVNLKTDEIIESILEYTEPMQYISPYIKKVEEVEEELKRIISLIKLYNSSEYIVISAIPKTDGKYGKDLSFSTDYLMGYIAENGKMTLDPINLNIEENKIVNKENKPKAKLIENNIEEWSEITIFEKDKPNIISQLQ